MDCAVLQNAAVTSRMILSSTSAANGVKHASVGSSEGATRQQLGVPATHLPSWPMAAAAAAPVPAWLSKCGLAPPTAPIHAPVTFMTQQRQQQQRRQQEQQRQQQQQHPRTRDVHDEAAGEAKVVLQHPPHNVESQVVARVAHVRRVVDRGACGWVRTGWWVQQAAGAAGRSGGGGGAGARIGGSERRAVAFIAGGRRRGLVAAVHTLPGSVGC